MSTLVLNSLDIKNFRGFRHLQIEHLGRVNLIVGKNNVGKSSLLEALQLYARKAPPALIWELLDARDESRYSPFSRLVNIEDLLSAIKYLFHGRKEFKAYLEPIQIGPINLPDEALFLTVGWYVTQEDESGNRKLHLLRTEDYNTADNPTPRFTIQIGRQPKISYSLRPDTLAPSRVFVSDLKEISCVFIGVEGIGKERIGKLWDDIALTDLEKDEISALRIIAPGVEGLSLIEDSRPVREKIRERERIPIVKITGLDEPLPLRSLGDGMQRVLGIALSLLNAKDGMLLIDEVENGIHYSAQLELWQFIFQLAHRLNVQVFATTHSWDCIEAFQKAASEDKQEEGMLIRLSIKQDNEVGVTLFDEEELAIVTREQIEVR